MASPNASGASLPGPQRLTHRSRSEPDLAKRGETGIKGTAAAQPSGGRGWLPGDKQQLWVPDADQLKGTWWVYKFGESEVS